MIAYCFSIAFDVGTWIVEVGTTGLGGGFYDSKRLDQGGKKVRKGNQEVTRKPSQTSSTERMC